jgi:subtilisin family serine protease
MKKLFLALLGGGMLLAFSSCEKSDSFVEEAPENIVLQDLKSGDIIPGQYVVVFKESALKDVVPENLPYKEKLAMVNDRAEKILEEVAIEQYKMQQTYASALKGFSIELSDEDADKVSKSEDVKYMIPDRIFILRPPWENPDPDPEPEGQETPYGIARVGTGDGTGKVAWILDTGIDLDHPDLNVDQTRGVNFVRTTKAPDDDNGHGSHCAGIVAAKDNDIGVVGVAAGATVVPIKVLDRRGSGAYSGIIAGIDYVAATAASGDAANMSLGGGAYLAIDEAVAAAADKGILFALAAGNESTDANSKSPARVNGANIFTISAMDSNDEWAYFSNYGNPPIDFCEPGVNIYSTYKGGGYTSMSGTSMAAPHMCGILLMTNGAPKTDGFVSGDPDGDPDPIGTL